jgi:hypothetical protein
VNGEAEILIEMRRLGDAVRVSAVCPETGLEATILGPAAAGEAALAKAAVDKLRWLRDKRGPRVPSDDLPARRKGLLV